MNTITEDLKKTLVGFDRIIQILYKEEPEIIIADRKVKPTFLNVSSVVYSSAPSSIIRYDYTVNDMKWSVWESPEWKICGDEANTYNYFFDKKTGFTVKFGTHVTDDPDWCPLGPDIADMEIVAGKCPKINGKNCAFCYKNNGGETANCMTLDEFKQLLDFMPKNLSQIAFGITGVKTNPEFFDIMKYAKDNGIAVNYTTNGVDLDDDCVGKTLDLCGRIAVSCYEGAKEICYDTMRRVGEAAKKRDIKFPCNIHIVLSKDTYNHVKDVLNDAKEGKIPNLGAIVILRIKPVGRAQNLNCSIPKEYYKEIVEFCLSNNIKFGFDSCGAKQVETVLKEIGRPELVNFCESCESTRMSIYVSCDRKITPCSFCEKALADTALDVSKIKSPSEFIAEWNNNLMLTSFRKATCACSTSCQMFDLD